MTKMITTTIRLNEAVKQELDKLKIHPREPYEEVIKKLIEMQKEQTK